MPHSIFWVKRCPAIGETVVVWPLSFAMAIRPVIFLPRDSHGWDEVSRRAILAHERVHHRQQRALGLPRFALAYYLSLRLRWRIEAVGYRREFAVYARYRRRPSPTQFARMVSGPFYGWMVGYRESLAWCEETLRRLDRTRNA
jgi:hypothetical protein